MLITKTYSERLMTLPNAILIRGRYVLLWTLLFAVEGLAAPDLSGTYDVGTLTPLQRPEAFGDNLYLTPQQAEVMAAGWTQASAKDAAASDPDRGAPPKGEFTNGYNLFWVDPGSTANLVGGRFRTSIITQPNNGRIPNMTQQGRARMQGMLDAWQIVWRNPDPSTNKDASTAWWMSEPGGRGPYDHIEQRPLAERCVLGSRSTAGPPMLPNIYNNHKRIIQTRDTLMILTEMNHDARVIRIGGVHPPESVRFWLGDSIAEWVGDELRIHTANFKSTPALSGADENLEVTETLRRVDEGIHYTFRVVDATVWSEPWAGEYVWPETDAKVYEYACHEGNYALGNILKGARALEDQLSDTDKTSS